jgi:hypothetical protein
MAPGEAPTPYTAGQIRAGCPDGRTVTFLMEAPGKDAFLMTMRFSGGDANGADVETSRTAPDGTPLPGQVTRRMGWKELQRHAAFPAVGTQVADATIRVRAGSFPCMRYTVTATDDDGKEVVQRYWFARSLPGPPVKMETVVAGETKVSMTLVSNDPGSAAAGG